MSELVEILLRPELNDPTLIIALDGWIDAGGAADTAAEVMSDQASVSTLATFSSDELLDYRARRPTMHLLAGVVTDLDWPKLELRGGTDAAGSDVLFLTGAEPDRLWRSFIATTVELALSFDVKRVIGLGAYPAPVPHTRASRLSITTSSQDVSDTLPGLQRGTLEVPAGVFAALDEEFNASGIPSFGLWAQVPHYASNLPSPAAARALVEGVMEYAGLSFTLEDLGGEVKASRLRLDALLESNPEHQPLVEQLEQAWDEGQSADAAFTSLDGPLPSGEELAAEFQEFLRDRDPED